MKKKISILLIGCCLTFALIGCGRTTVNVNVEKSEELHNTVLGIDSLISIGDKLYYDSTTRIVYWWNGYLSVEDWATTPTPYYAPNGYPYKYNPETKTFEEITCYE